MKREPGHLFGALAALALVSTTGFRHAYADDAVPNAPPTPSSAPVSSSAPASSSAPTQPELALDIEPNAGGLAPANIRAAIERELASPTTTATSSSPAVLSIRARGEHRVLMTFRQANGRQVDREVVLPREPARAAETIALLAVNLVRNEAAELLAAMVEKQRPPVVPAPPLVAPPSPALSDPTLPSAAPLSTAPPSAAPPAAPLPTTDAPATAAPLPTTNPAPPPPPCERRYGYHFVQWGADVAPFVGSSQWEPPRTVRRFSLEFAGGHSEGVHGVGVSPLVHMTSGFVCGAEIAAIGNIVGGPVQGVQLGGIFNMAHHVRGVQLASVASVARGVDGIQGATVNVSRGDVSGIQAGIVNVTSGTVRGIQVGLVNYADDSDFSLGLVNIMRKGRFGVDGFAAETGFFTLALKNGGKHWHSSYGVTYRPSRNDPSGDNLRFGYTLGLGAHATPSNHAFFDVDLFGSAIGGESKTFSNGHITGYLAEVRAVVGIRPMRHVSIYAGPSYNVYFTEDVGTDPPIRSRLVATTETSSFSYSQWPGFTAGIQLMTGD